uniref:Transferrin receptor n=1 Tax=Gongylonema pulchrum TaxID=637853 RepID=A0A183DJ46_9BILA
LARIFGSENTKSERPTTDESSNKIGCFGGKAEDDDGVFKIFGLNYERKK